MFAKDSEAKGVTTEPFHANVSTPSMAGCAVWAGKFMESRTGPWEIVCRLRELLYIIYVLEFN